ncbi:hypothetical protein AB0N05_12060 [Nocardia sp. NPDC051030]|uniref:hypothetical protein n=1 Tax=Nocardia sp. NPDC051030 TaxID=3155162 RepID=UPI003431C728
MKIAELADRTRADAEVLSAGAASLRELRQRLATADAMPAWFDAEIRAHIDRCGTAANDLAAAADNLDAHARALGERDS